MKEYRIRYFIALIVVFIITIIFNNKVFLAIDLTMILLPIILRISLLFNAKNFRLEFKTKKSALINSDIGFFTNYFCKFMFSSAGLLIIKVEFCNNIFNVIAEETFILPLGQNKDEINLPYKSDLCGELTIKFKSIKACDFLGLSTVNIKNPKNINMIIYPRKIDITALFGQQPYNNSNIGHINSSKKGTDNTENFYLREYQAGDPIKNIHWKLSVKTDNFIVKQSSDLFNYDILFYVDMSLTKKGIRLSNQQISTVLEIGISLGKSITLSGIKYKFSMPIEDKMYTVPIDDIQSYYKVLQQTLSLNINPFIDCNKLIEKYHIDILNSNYSKFVFVCWEMYPPILEYISEFINVIVIIIYDHNKKFDTIETNKLHIVTLSDDKLYESVYTINI